MTIDTSPVAGKAGLLQVWDTDSQQPLDHFSKESNAFRYFYQVDWSPDGAYLAFFDKTNALTIYDFETGATVGTIPDPNASDIVLWSPDPDVLGYRSGDGFRIVNWKNGEEVTTLPIDFPYGSTIAWNPDSDRNCLSSWNRNDDQIHVWNTESGEKIETVEAGVHFAHLAWNREGDQLAAGIGVGVKTWDWDGKNSCAELRSRRPRGSRAVDRMEPRWKTNRHQRQRWHCQNPGL